MEATERVEKLLALILIHDMQETPQSDRAHALRKAGFSNAEIADLLGTTAAVIGQQLYERRRAGKRRGITVKAQKKPSKKDSAR